MLRILSLGYPRIAKEIGIQLPGKDFWRARRNAQHDGRKGKRAWRFLLDILRIFTLLDHSHKIKKKKKELSNRNRQVSLENSKLKSELRNLENEKEQLKNVSLLLDFVQLWFFFFEMTLTQSNFLGAHFRSDETRKNRAGVPNKERKVWNAAGNKGWPKRCHLCV